MQPRESRNWWLSSTASRHHQDTVSGDQKRSCRPVGVVFAKLPSDLVPPLARCTHFYSDDDAMYVFKHAVADSSHEDVR